MIFEGRSIDDITDDEFDDLVTKHYSERQCLEFKITVNHKEDEERIELLRDIASLANGGGGYLIIGIRDDGKGKAQKYEPSLIGDTEKIRNAIIGLCHEHIKERIDGLDVVIREVKGNPLVIVRIPFSGRRPHMVTYKNSTDFHTRYQDGKRIMTIGEIREGFIGDLMGLRLSKIESHLQKLIGNEESERAIHAFEQRIKSGATPQLLLIEDGKALSEVAFRRFEIQAGKAPYFRIAVTPMLPRSNLIDLDSPDLRRLLEQPPGSRPSGWNMDLSRYAPKERFSEGLRVGISDFEYLEVLANGHCEFWTPLDAHFCWRQSEVEFKQRPRLYPHAVTEYPTTFLRLYLALIELFNITGQFLVALQYLNLKGYLLHAFAPGDIRMFYLYSDRKTFDNEHYISPPMVVPHTFNPDEVAFELLKGFYASNGLDAEAIPFYDMESQRFEFPSS
jgi:hypothetical protein